MTLAHTQPQHPRPVGRRLPDITAAPEPPCRGRRAARAPPPIPAGSASPSALATTALRRVCPKLSQGPTLSVRAVGTQDQEEPEKRVRTSRLLHGARRAGPVPGARAGDGTPTPAALAGDHVCIPVPRHEAAVRVFPGNGPQSGEATPRGHDPRERRRGARQSARSPEPNSGGARGEVYRMPEHSASGSQRRPTVPAPGRKTGLSTPRRRGRRATPGRCEGLGGTAAPQVGQAVSTLQSGQVSAVGRVGHDPPPCAGREKAHLPPGAARGVTGDL